MASPVYTKKTLGNGQVQYHKDGNLVAKATIDENVLARLNASPEGTPVPESAEVVPTDDTEVVGPETTPVPESAGEKPAKLVKIHLERNQMVNGKVYLGGYDVETDEETGDVLSETPIEIEVTEEMAEELKRNDRNHTTYERNLLRGNNRAKTAPQVKDVREAF